MTKQVLFIQGGGDDGYTEDAKLVASLKQELGNEYEINYPHLQSDDSPDFGWLKQIGDEINKHNDGVILVAHSLGASFLLKYLSENNISKRVGSIHLIATPFWQGEEEWKQGLKLEEDFTKYLPKNTSITFYHCVDDEEVPFKHFELYKHKLPIASFRIIESGGHQLNNNLSPIAKEINGN